MPRPTPCVIGLRTCDRSELCEGFSGAGAGYLDFEEVLGRAVKLLERLLACVWQGLHLEVVGDRQLDVAREEVGGAGLREAKLDCRRESCATLRIA